MIDTRGRPTRATGVQLGGSLAGKLSSELSSTSSAGVAAGCRGPDRMRWFGVRATSSGMAASD
jgi:hypothetical protein